MQRACLAVRRAPRRARTLPDLLTPISEPWRLREHVPWRKFYRNAHGGAGRALLARSGSRHLAHKSLASCLTSPARGTTPRTAILRRSASPPSKFRNPAQPCAGFAGYPAGTLQEFAAGYPAPGDQPCDAGYPATLRRVPCSRPAGFRRRVRPAGFRACVQRENANIPRKMAVLLLSQPP